MEIDERIRKLETYKKAVISWVRSANHEQRQELRTFLNQNKNSVRREVLEARCFKTMTVTPPAAIGGLIIRNVDPFDSMFDPPYGINLVSSVVDMIDEAIGVLSSSADKPDADDKSTVQVETDIEVGYAFIAMPIDPTDAQLEDVLDAIKEACDRCGLKAARVDESESNERITDRILESVRRAEYVIVDLTDSKPNVFYEAGYAQGHGLLD